MFRRISILLFTISILISLNQSFAQITTQAQWDSIYNEIYPTSEPLLDVGNNEESVYSWQAHYWIRAYVSMAQTFSDSLYLDKAVKLIDHIFNQTDEARYNRSELDLANEPYFSAPLPYLQNRNLPAPGWRNGSFGDGWRIQTLDDGQITHAIMRFVELVLSNEKFSVYQHKAWDYVEKVVKIVDSHNSLFVFNRFQDVPGTYFYPRQDGAGLWSGDVPINHAATMGVTLLLLDKVKGGGTEYRKMAEAILAYFKLNIGLQKNNSYIWKYNFRNENSPVEDFNHGHLDISFLVLACQLGLDISKDEMAHLANTLTQNILRNDGSLNWFIDGNTEQNQDSFWPIGFDWIDLTEFSPQIFEIAKTYYSKNYPTPTWARPFLGWAEILRWQKKMNYTIDEQAPEPPQNVNLEY